MPAVFLVLSCLGLLAVLNALRPLRWTPVVLPSFFAAWLTAELAPQLLVLLVAATAVLLAAGGLDGFLGLTALGLTGLTALGLGLLVRRSEQAAVVADQALAGVPDIGATPGSDRSRGLRRFFVPLAFRHPDVERLVGVSYSALHPRHRLDVYRRRDHPTGCPTLVQVHGGGWVIGDKREQGRPLMLALAARGWVCFAPNYRLSPQATFPDHLIDVKRALAWVRAHGTEYGADPGFVVLTGGSAGGHLVALAALTANDPTYQPGFPEADTAVQGCVPYYGVYDLAAETGTRAAQFRARSLLRRLVLKSADPEAFRRASPLTHVRADAPPFFVIHGRNDTLVPVEEARLFVQRLRAVSAAPVAYLELPGTQHAFDIFGSIRSAHVVRAVERFVETLRRADAALTRSAAPPPPSAGS